MPFRAVRADTVRRIVELQNLHRNIVSNETGPRVPPDHAAQKGLFIVCLYGLIEFSITSLIRTAVVHINSVQVRHDHLAPDLMPMVCEPVFTAAEAVRGENKWRRRQEVIKLSGTSTACQIRDGILGAEVMNTGRSTIELVFSLFAIDVSPIPNPVVGIYLEEIRERRNAVAHGRESAADVGGRFSAAELGTRLRQYEDLVTHMVVSFEDMLSSRAFIRAGHRAGYP